MENGIKSRKMAGGTDQVRAGNGSVSTSLRRTPQQIVGGSEGGERGGGQERRSSGARKIEIVS